MDKSPDAFRTISEVAEDLDVPQHVLRFWESRSGQIKPMKRGGGRRYYRPEDVDLLRGIRHLLYGEGYTIRGVQRILREQGGRFVQSVWREGAEQPTLQPHEEAGDSETEAHGAEHADVGDEAPKAGTVTAPAPARQSASAPVATPTPPAVPLPVGPILSAEDIRQLRSALETLTDCRRRLDQMLAG
jgi:DNA-binding transcriptional MerR regulator